MSPVCEAEMREMKVCLHRCTKWKAHQDVFKGRVQQLCPITFRLTNLSQLMCSGDKKWKSYHYECATHESAEKHARSMVFNYTMSMVLWQHRLSLCPYAQQQLL